MNKTTVPSSSPYTLPGYVLFRKLMRCGHSYKSAMGVLNEDQQKEARFAMAFNQRQIRESKKLLRD